MQVLVIFENTYRVSATFVISNVCTIRYPKIYLEEPLVVLVSSSSSLRFVMSNYVLQDLIWIYTQMIIFIAFALSLMREVFINKL